MSIKANLTVQQVSDWMTNSRRNASTKLSEKNRLNTENKLLLLKNFDQNKDPNKKIIENIAKQTGLTEKRIKAWFRFQRFKQKNVNSDKN